MDRAKIQNQIRMLYDARLSNDADQCAGLFAEGAEFRFATASPALSLPGPLDTKATLELLVSVWKWREVRDLKSVVEGMTAATHFTLVAEHAPSGKILTSEIADRIEFNEELLVTRFIEFADTAEVERTLANG